MRFKALGLMKSNPGFTMVNHFQPVDVSAQAKGSVKAEIGAISLNICEIPFKVRIPFLKRRKYMTVVGSVGGTCIKIDPVSLSMNEVGLSLEAVLGKLGKGVTVHTDAKVSCQTQMEASGCVGGKVGIGSVDLGDDCDIEVCAETENPMKQGKKKK